ncbi:N-acetylornithine carbamoyltransferase [Bacteroidetes bacterium endosymbiont of Geopemphigus sp.]|uniref:N-acetylornithine carbamoyltransferase n=1 Tax=Bacteroidetes bacterium endosymbiont of Geopemphigus sp. TaxID=2047937 RepID=UPI000CD0848A|nr:N-acetylornithine carbamoyltransferase [Bacteroidetes bacterium endosymbiont of Geopemphigus sp.]
MKRFFSVADVPDVPDLVKEALLLKKDPYGQFIGNNKTIGLVFFNPSLRTRLSSQKAAFHLGCDLWVLNIDHDSWKIEMSDGTMMENTQEHIKEAIEVIGLYCDILGVRTFPGLKNKQNDYQEVLFKKIERYSRVPVVSLESATRHPLQSLADAMTIEELRPSQKPIKVVLSWAPHPKALPHSVPNSFLEWISKLRNTDLIITHPKGYELDKEFAKDLHITYDQEEAFREADFIYAKNWSAYNDYGQILCKDSRWMITSKKMALTNHAKFMHCLPVRRNIVVEDAVLDADTSVVLQQAQNRIFAAQAVFKRMLINKCHAAYR